MHFSNKNPVLLKVCIFYFIGFEYILNIHGYSMFKARYFLKRISFEQNYQLCYNLSYDTLKNYQYIKILIY